MRNSNRERGEWKTRRRIKEERRKRKGRKKRIKLRKEKYSAIAAVDAVGVAVPPLIASLNTL